NPELKNLLDAHLSLLYTKEYFVRGRNLLFPLFIDNKLSDSLHALFIQRVGQYELSREKFLLAANDSLRNHYLNGLERTTSKTVHDLMHRAINSPQQSAELMAADWWNISAAVIDRQVETEHLSLQLIRGFARDFVAAINR